jgi:hypothetical protein
MPTTTKARRSKPPTKGQSSHGFLRPRETTPTKQPGTRFPRTSTKPAAKAPSGLIGRAQAILPGREPPTKKKSKGAVSSLGAAKNSERKPSKKGIVGIVAGGLGVAAMAKRRRGGNQDDMAPTPPVQPVEPSGEDLNPPAG